jgi:hypothetical protein
VDDSFGGFETGNELRLGVPADTDDDPWSPSAGDDTFPSVHDASVVEADPAAGGDAWNSDWPGKHEDEAETSPAADEWELARTRKERRDRKIVSAVSLYLVLFYCLAGSLIYVQSPPKWFQAT